VNLDKLYDLTAVGIKTTALLMLTRAQKERPAQITAAIATLFLAVCRRYRIEPRRVLEVTDRIMRDAQEKHPVEMRAMARYLKEELPDD